MHRVDTKKRRSLVLRYVAYTTTLVLSVVTTIILLFFAQGYRLDSKSGHVVRSGLLLVDNTPQAGQVYVNGELKDGSTPSRFVLKTGQYELSLEREGYHGWKKQIEILASGVEEVYYPRMIPKSLNPKQILELPTPTFTSQSLDRKQLLLHVKGENQLRVIRLDPKTPEQTLLTLPSSVRRENGQLGTFTSIEWALDNEHVLLEQTLPSGAKDILSLDIIQPSQTINISALFGAQMPAQVHYVGSRTNQIYGLKENILGRYNLQTGSIDQILLRVRSYQPYGDDILLFARNNENQTTVESGLWQDNKAVVVHRVPKHEGQDLLRYGEYDNHTYFAVGQTVNNNIVIYRNPLQTPVLKSQLPFSTLLVEQPQKLTLSDNSQFLLAQRDRSLNVYDFDHVDQYHFTASENLEPGYEIKWSDAYRLLLQLKNNAHIVIEYDGANQVALPKSLPGNTLHYSDNYQHLFRIFDDKGKTSLEAISLVVGEE